MGGFFYLVYIRSCRFTTPRLISINLTPYPYLRYMAHPLTDASVSLTKCTFHTIPPILFVEMSSSDMERSFFAVSRLMDYPPCSWRALLPRESLPSPPLVGHSRFLSPRSGRPLRTFSRTKACLNSLTPHFHYTRHLSPGGAVYREHIRGLVGCTSRCGEVLQVTKSVGRQVRRRQRQRQR